MKDKRTAILCFIASVCFYLSAVVSSTYDVSTAVVNLCLGSTFLCLGVVWLNKDKSKKEDDNK